MEFLKLSDGNSLLADDGEGLPRLCSSGQRERNIGADQEYFPPSIVRLSESNQQIIKF